VRPSIVKSGSRALIEFYPSDQFKTFHADTHHYIVMRNNVAFSFSDERHELTEASEMRHVLEIKSVTPEDAGEYRVDCLGFIGTSNTAYLRIAGLCYILSNLIFYFDI